MTRPAGSAFALDPSRIKGTGEREPLTVPCSPDFYSGPATASAYVSLPDRVSGVRVRRPSGTVSGGPLYPRGITPQPKLPAVKSNRAYREWEFFRAESLDPTPKPWPFPTFLDNPACRWLQALKKLYSMPITFPASLSPEAGLLLHAIVRNARPRTVIETGTFLGASALWIGAALADSGDGGVLHCFDDFIPVKPGPWRLQDMKEGVLEFVARMMAEAGLADTIVLHPGNTSYEIRACAQEMLEAGGVQLAYLDADHRPRAVCQDLWALEPVLPTGGLVVVHDTFPGVCGDDGPRFLLDAVNEVAVGSYQVADLFLSPINYGMGILRRIG
jgi:predicted O-methyltransferase YrrM